MASQYTAGLTGGQVLTAATMNSIGAAWETWTPTVTSSGGTLGSVTINSAKYGRIQKIVFCSFDITITAVGTGSGSLNITLPITGVTGQNGKAVGVWRERSVTGDMGFVNFATTTLAFCQRYDQGAILNTGRTFAGTFTYEAA